MKITQMEPFGALLEADQDSLVALDASAIAEILDTHALALFRGFAPLSNADYLNFSRQFGQPYAWEFGEILELKIQEHPSNHIFGQGRVELHWDGAYVQDRPHYNLFQCLRGAHSAGGGETLFVDTRRLLAQAETREVERWRGFHLQYSTEKKAHYGGNFQSALITASPYDGQEVVRYIEPFNEDNAAINPVDVRVLELPVDESNTFLHDFNRRLYADHIMYRHRWQAGDFLMADNSRLLHGRSRFLQPGDSRYIKRINIL